MMTEHDKELQTFFHQMKEKNGKIQVPDFPELTKKSSLNWWIPMGIAASLALGFWFVSEKEPESGLQHDVIIITLEEDANNEMQFKIESTTELESWESSTSSLLTEFQQK